MTTADDSVNVSTSEPAMSDYVMAYCDIPGQKKKLELLKKQANDQERDDFHRLYNETYRAVLGLRQRVTAALQSSLQDAVKDSPSLTDGHTTRTPCHIAFFSDCLAVTLRWSDHNGHPPIMDIWHLLIALSIWAIKCVGAHSPLRGAIEVGSGFEWPDGGGVYGPISSDVYELESQVAGYPRIVVGPKLNDHIRIWARNVEHNDSYYIANKSWIENCNGLISIDRDGIPILDYLSQGVFYCFGHCPEIVAAIRLGFEFVGDEFERFQNEQDLKMLSRYFLLREYYSTRLREFWSVS